MRRALIRPLLLVLLLAAPALAEKGPRKMDLFWKSPEFAAYEPRSIAMLPAATYDGSTEARQTVEAAVAKAFREKGYRWTSALVTRDRMMKAGGDSLVKALNGQLLKNPRLDSLEAPAYARMMVANALLTIRVDRYEQYKLEVYQSGKPTTTVGLTAALVDSSGRLLWTASGVENAEGVYYTAGSSQLDRNPAALTDRVTPQGGPPSYVETLSKLLVRWVPEFPAKTPAPADTAARN
jgi:hypothetical protein